MLETILVENFIKNRTKKEERYPKHKPDTSYGCEKSRNVVKMVEGREVRCVDLKLVDLLEVWDRVEEAEKEYTAQMFI